MWKVANWLIWIIPILLILLIAIFAFWVVKTTTVTPTVVPRSEAQAGYPGTLPKDDPMRNFPFHACPPCPACPACPSCPECKLLTPHAALNDIPYVGNGQIDTCRIERVIKSGCNKPTQPPCTPIRETSTTFCNSETTNTGCKITGLSDATTSPLSTDSTKPIESATAMKATTYAHKPTAETTASELTTTHVSPSATETITTAQATTQLGKSRKLPLWSGQQFDRWRI